MTKATPPTANLELEIEGMTCASCATRVERKLNGLGGVEASVMKISRLVTLASAPSL
jgi:copper chaperone CopZ